MQPQTETGEPGFFDMLFSKYDAIWKSIILPPRRDYCLEMLGPELRRVDSDSAFKRRDGFVVNPRGEKICLSFFELLRVDKTQRVSSRCLLYLHTHGANRLEGLGLANEAAGLGMNFCCFDFAGSGKSEGKFTTLGVRESDDCRAVMDHLKRELGIKSFVIWGRSMGAVTALLTCAGAKPPVDCLVLDSPFADVEHLVRDAGNSFIKLGEYLAIAVFSFVRDDIKQQLGHDLGSLRPLDSCKDCHVPCIFVAAKDDQLVPLERVREMFDHVKARDKWLLEVEGTHSSERKPHDVQKVVARIHNLLRRPEASQCASIPYSFGIHKPNLRLLAGADKSHINCEGDLDRIFSLKHSRSEQALEFPAHPIQYRNQIAPLNARTRATPAEGVAHVSANDDRGSQGRFVQNIESIAFYPTSCHDTRMNSLNATSVGPLGSPRLLETEASQFRHHKPFNSGERRLMETIGPTFTSARPAQMAFKPNDRSGAMPQPQAKSPTSLSSTRNDHTRTLAEKITLQKIQHMSKLERMPSSKEGLTFQPYTNSSLSQRAAFGRTINSSSRPPGPKLSFQPPTADRSTLQIPFHNDSSSRPISAETSRTGKPTPQIFSPEKQFESVEYNLGIGRCIGDRSIFQETPVNNFLASQPIAPKPSFYMRGGYQQAKENSPSSLVWSTNPKTKPPACTQKCPNGPANPPKRQVINSTRNQTRENRIRIFEERTGG